MTNKRDRIFLVLGILFFGILLRWQFGSGLVTEEELTLAKSASMAACTDLSECFDHISTARALVGIKNTIFLMPTSIFYAILGVNDLSSALQGFIFSVASGLILYCLATRLAGETSGSYALFLWAINPVEVFSSRIPNLVNIKTFVCLLFILVMLSSLGKKRPPLLALLVVVGFLVEMQLGLFLLALFIFTQKPEHFDFKRTAIVGSMTVFLLELANPYFIQETLSNLIDFFQLPENVVWIPAVFLALVQPLTGIKRKTPCWALAWFFLAIVLSLAPRCSSFACSQGALTAGEAGILRFSPIFAPAILIIATELGSRRSNLPTLKSILGILVLIFLSIQMFVSQQKTIYDLSDPLSLNKEYLIVFSSLTVALAFVFPFFIVAKQAHKRIGYANAVLAYMFFFAFASLNFFEANSAASRFLLQGYRSSLSIIDQQKLSLPVVVESEGSKLLLEYVNSFKEIKVRVSENRTLSNNVYALSSTKETNRFVVQPTWWNVGGYYGLRGDAVSIYRVLEASVGRELADTAAQEERTAALVNAGLLCEGYLNWLANPPASDAARFLEISGNCLSNQTIVPILDESDSLFKLFAGIDGGVKPGGENELGEQIWSVSNYIPFYPDWRVYNIPVYLEVDNAYLLTLTVRTQVPTISLYIGNEKNEWFVPQKIYSDWTNVQVLFSTYGMDQEDTLVLFSPVLFDHYQNIELTKFSLGRIK